MGIGWLWHFTPRDGEDRLRTDNEHRAATAYALWRATFERLSAWTARRREARLRRAGQRELEALPDHLLQDLGLLREGSGAHVTDPATLPYTPLRPARAPTGAHPANLVSLSAVRAKAPAKRPNGQAVSRRTRVPLAARPGKRPARRSA